MAYLCRELQREGKRVFVDLVNNAEDPSARPNQGKKTKTSKTKESEPSKKSYTSKESSKGKSPAKTSKFSKSVTAKEPVEEIVFEMTSDKIEQTVDDVANDVDQPPDDSTQTKDKDPKKDWFKQPPRPPTPDQEWNKRQVNNPEGDSCPFNLTKPLPLKGHPGRLTVAAEYFFNNDLEFLKSSDLEKKYITSITKTKAAQYEIVGIEDMISAKQILQAQGLLYSKDSQCDAPVIRTASAVAKPCQGDSLESYLITGSQPATDNSSEVQERTILETFSNITPENKAYYDAEKEAIHLLLTRIGDEIYSNFDACKTAHDMWIAIERLQQEVNEIGAEKIAKNANPPAVVAAAQ
ncbi:hypothetical protein Tco_0366762 [Tanacetum coccineum]